jgi:hypothetical protein
MCSLQILDAVDKRNGFEPTFVTGGFGSLSWVFMVPVVRDYGLPENKHYVTSKKNQKVADSHFPALAEVTTVTPTVEVATVVAAVVVTVVAVEVATVVVVTEAAVVSAVVPAVTACLTSALA